MIVLMDLHDATLTNIDHSLMRLIFKVVLVSDLVVLFLVVLLLAMCMNFKVCIGMPMCEYL